MLNVQFYSCEYFENSIAVTPVWYDSSSMILMKKEIFSTYIPKIVKILVSYYFALDKQAVTKFRLITGDFMAKGSSIKLSTCRKIEPRQLEELFLEILDNPGFIHSGYGQETQFRHVDLTIRTFLETAVEKGASKEEISKCLNIDPAKFRNVDNAIIKKVIKQYQNELAIAIKEPAKLLPPLKFLDKNSLKQIIQAL